MLPDQRRRRPLPKVRGKAPRVRKSRRLWAISGRAGKRARVSSVRAWKTSVLRAGFPERRKPKRPTRRKRRGMRERRA